MNLEPFTLLRSGSRSDLPYVTLNVVRGLPRSPNDKRESVVDLIYLCHASPTIKGHLEEMTT